MDAFDSKKRLVIAIGTGRSGSVSLYQLLNQQPGVDFYHEQSPLLPWKITEDLFHRKINKILKRKSSIVGDICHSWLPYIPMLLECYPESRVICLERDCEEVVSSFLNKLRRKKKNHWILEHGKQWRRDSRFDPTFPKFPLMELEVAIRRYCLEYRQSVDALVKKHPGRIRKWRTEVALNHPDVASELLAFVGIEPGHQILKLGDRHNASRTEASILRKHEPRFIDWLKRLISGRLR